MKEHAQHAPLAQFIQAFRHELHQHPELSNQEFETTRKIRAVLEKEGIRILDLPLKTGLVAEVGGLQDGPLVVVRSDIDALPIEEESGVAFSSKNAGVMHACGHDFHSSAALGAAILLKRIEPELKGTVRILFQAAEETGLGAPEVIAVGALDGATAIFGIHNDPTLPVGVIGGKDGALTAGVDRFEIKIAAKGCHAAKPHEGNDPIIILGQLISAVQTIISRTVASDNNAVVSITQVHSGSTWNVIPDTAYVEGTVRTFSQAVRDLIEQRFRQIVAGIASTFGAEIEFIWHAGPPSVVNTPRWVDFALQVADDEGFEARRVEASPIGEDFAFYQQKLPGTFMMVGSGGPYALHHPKFRVDDSALFPTAHYLYQLAKQSLEQPSQVA
ncbi:amidohydrolase [Dickeya dianthicola]|uniref:Amidohydrolase n=1 Tax=Dickeya dianthicola TaxID=204039 RepID=A0ABX9NKK7_9GAMM|nr:M20 peptidase aminoacylase family protein [Dickeya dianthicola]MCI4114807.1 M20 peptidase aminoacylase family protein [Dickeya dianthicola]MCI4120244.1 M20 peptidase aminoacylase family protein [Dickeya dianthicola]MCI4122897.1 M20 peptidase aminoacylase family protein [Dickeya dianthicola]MCI4191931.1 M20 peptidase aminoacylase family protein [Dickeya dianthicola]MCI4198876.1 M20 peptidase aminoacylase family protein [Dickeya dianthicola]